MLTEWECRLRFLEPVLGKVPKDPEKLLYVMRKRPGTPQPTETEVAQESSEVNEVSEAQENTFYKDDSGFYLKPIDIIGMLKERGRQLGMTRQWGFVSAIEGLRVTPLRIYLFKDGRFVTKEDGAIPKPIHKSFGPPSISICAKVDPPVEIEFKVAKAFDKITAGKKSFLSDNEFEELLKGCFKLGGLRKEYGTFEWLQTKRIN